MRSQNGRKRKHSSAAQVCQLDSGTRLCSRINERAPVQAALLWARYDDDGDGYHTLGRYVAHLVRESCSERRAPSSGQTTGGGPHLFLCLLRNFLPAADLRHLARPLIWPELQPSPCARLLCQIQSRFGQGQSLPGCCAKLELISNHLLHLSWPSRLRQQM